jgi:hypothetical protein
MTKSRSRITVRWTITAAALAALASGTTAPAASADTAATQQASYVASLLRLHSAGTAYTQMDDYVRTLVFWKAHPDWTVRG